MALGPLAATLFSYLFLLFFDRDRLQSESYLLRKQALEIIEEKGSLSIIDGTSIHAISNPDVALVRDTSERRSDQ
jgi:hypothetical protein